MKVNSYKYIKPEDTGVIPELDRLDYMTVNYIDTVYDYLQTIELKGKSAFLYAGGATLSASECRIPTGKVLYREPIRTSGVGVKEMSAYSMHKWIGALKGKENIEYANINGNTCASSMYSLYEASRLLNEGYDEVVIVAEEKTSYSTIRIFDEHKVDLKIGEGLAIIHLTKGDQITDCKWGFEYSRNPFGVTESGYTKVFTQSDLINPHGTGTDINEAAEYAVYGNTPQLRYKEDIGHTQGVSGLLEVCMVLDEDVTGDVLCVSSGLGGFYGSCIVHM